MSMKAGAARAARGVETGVQGLCRAVLMTTGATLLAVLVINVVVRYILEGSVGALSEVPALVFPWFVMAGVVQASLKGQHVGMQLALHTLPPVGRRVLALFIHALSAAVFLMLAWYAVENTLIAHDEKSTILRVPGSVGYAAIVLTFLFVGISSLCALVRHGLAGEEVLVDLAADNGGVV